MHVATVLEWGCGVVAANGQLDYLKSLTGIGAAETDAFVVTFR